MPTQSRLERSPRRMPNPSRIAPTPEFANQPARRRPQSWLREGVEVPGLGHPAARRWTRQDAAGGWCAARPRGRRGLPGRSVDERSSYSAAGDRARRDGDPYVASARRPWHDAWLGPQADQFLRRDNGLGTPSDKDAPTGSTVLVDVVDLESHLRGVRELCQDSVRRGSKDDIVGIEPIGHRQHLGAIGGVPGHRPVLWAARSCSHSSRDIS